MHLRPLLAATTALAALAGPATAEMTLHVLHVNDTHSRIESINKYDATCDAEDEAAGECFGGSARLYTAINQLRDQLVADGQNVLVIDAGDQFQGSLFYTTYKGAAEAEFMNAIGFDVMMIGNHEFDDGPDGLAGFAEKADVTIISGNVDVHANNRLPGLVEEYLVLDVGGERVGIVGALTRDTAEIATPGPSIGFEDEVAYLTDVTARLQAEGVDKIIAVTHVGVELDKVIAAEVPGLDAIVGGHSHTLFSNTLENARYPYPLMVDGPTGPVPVVQAGAYTKYLGHLVLTFDNDGNVTEATGDTVLLDASVEPNAELVARIGELAEPIDELMGVVIGRTAGDIDGSRENCRAGECAMGNLVAEAMLDRVRGQGVTIAIQNGGGLRASIGAGEVTMGDVFAVLPFQNTLATFQLTGAGIVAALENGLSQVQDGAGRFPQVAGLRYTWSPAKDPGSRVIEVLVEQDGAWVPIDPEALYGVVSNNFMRNGGDGYAVFRDDGMKAYDYGPGLEEVVATYLAAQGDYQPFTDGRITYVP